MSTQPLGATSICERPRDRWAGLVSSLEVFGQNFAAYARPGSPIAARLVAALAAPLNVSAALADSAWPPTEQNPFGEEARRRCCR